MKHSGICQNCGSVFTRSRPLRGITCSRKCAGELRRRKTAIKKSCPGCGKEFTTSPSCSTTWCSIQCFNRRPVRNADMFRNCQHCGKRYKRSPGQTKRKFCCRRCAVLAQHGQLQLRLRVFKKTNRKKAGSRRHARAAIKQAFPRCQRCGWDEEPQILHVHHKDRNRANNTPGNLEVLCPTCHVLEHFQAGDAIWGHPRS